MEFKLTFKVNEKIYLKDPESSDLGRSIVKHGLDLLHELGFEAFTFKKLAARLNTAEASIYRYFENKHRLLLYILNWYWSYLEFLVTLELQKDIPPGQTLTAIVSLLTDELPEKMGKSGYNMKYLHEIVLSESSKVYLVKEVNDINRDQVFKPYKDLCGKIAGVIQQYAPNYKYSRSLSSTLIETSHHQQFFRLHLPKLTDAQNTDTERYTEDFLKDFLFKILDAGK